MGDSNPPKLAMLTAGISCVDPRLIRIHPSLLEAYDDEEGFHLYSIAGGASGLLNSRARNGFIANLGDLWSKKCDDNTALVIALHCHEDCGAAGGSRSFRDMNAELAHHYAAQQEAANRLYDALSTDQLMSSLSATSISITHHFLMLSGQRIAGSRATGAFVYTGTPGHFVDEPVAAEHMDEGSTIPFVPERVGGLIG